MKDSALSSKELRERSIEELEDLYDSVSREIFALFNQLRVTKRLERPHQLKVKRRERARVLTILREKELKARSMSSG